MTTERSSGGATSAPGDAPAPSPDGGASPGWARWVQRLSVAAALVAMGVTIWAVGLWTILGHLRSIGWLFLVIVGIEVVITTLDAAAIHVLAGDTRYRDVLVAQVAGRAINAVTPGATLGEVTKATMLIEATSTTRAVSAVIYPNLVGIVISLAMMAIGAPLTALLVPVPDELRLVLLGGAALAAAAAIVLAVLVRRGMLTSLVGIAATLGIVSSRRRQRWHAKLDAIDQRLRGTATGRPRKFSAGYVLASRACGWLSIWLILAFAGYRATLGELGALLSAGILLGWVANVVPMGVGVTESGNYLLFLALGAPPALGVALALARRINFILYAAIGLSVLALWRLTGRGRRGERSPPPRPPEGARHVDA